MRDISGANRAVWAERGDDRVPYEAAHQLVNGFAPHLRESPKHLD